MPETHDGKVFLTQTEFDQFFQVGIIIDARKGGLILGNAHSNSGIKTLQMSKNGMHQIVAELDIVKRKYFKDNGVFIKTRLNNFAKTWHKDFIDFATTFE